MKSEDEQSLEPGVGALLRASRLRLGEELQDVSAILRIRYPYLEAIEEGRYEDLPGASYAVGFVRTYAEHLGLDSEEVVRRFKVEAENLEGRPALVFPSPIAERGTPGAAIVFIGILLVGVAYGAWYVGSSKDSVFDNIVPALPERLATLLSDDPAKPADPVSATPTPVEMPQTPQQSPIEAPPLVAPPAESMPVENAPAESAPETPPTPPTVTQSTPPAPAPAPVIVEPPVAEVTAAPAVEPVVVPTPVATPTPEPQIASEPAPPATPEVVPVVEPVQSVPTPAPEIPQPTPQVAETPVEPVPETPVESAPQVAEVPSAPAPEVPAPPAPPVAPAPTPRDTLTAADLAVAETRALREAPAPAQPETPVTPEPTVAETVVAQPEPEPVAPVEEPVTPPEPAASVEPAAPAEEPTAQTEPAAPATPAAPIEAATVAETPAPASQIAAIPAAPEVTEPPAPAEPAPAVADSAADIVVRAKSDSWIQVRDGVARRLLVTRLLRAGDSYRVPDRPGLSLLTGNAGALEILVGGKAVAPIGGVGAVRRNVALDAERLRSGTAVLD
ncbi:MAG: DUF4115 domain-containing protein [Rhodospirillales bacterium]|jgi:cytoskeleton protein RodZ|nr:DUF4115 domain-containing protein [Rhodospirillales bacterium]